MLGARGSGTAEHFGLKGEVDLELGTMSKALAGLGGFVVGDEAVVEYLRFYSNSYVFAANIPAATAAGLIAALDVLESRTGATSVLWRNIRALKRHLVQAGFDLGESDSAVIPVLIGEDALALRLGRAVRARGLFCQTVVYLGRVGDARLRISVSSEHTDQERPRDLAARDHRRLQRARSGSIPERVQLNGLPGTHELPGRRPRRCSATPRGDCRTRSPGSRPR